ncbi:hypothetical protein WA026_016034 [Henosepilachna vigintioctopunctata]
MAINHEAHNASDQSRFSKFSKLYSNYFPTDKESFSIRYSIIGLVISLFSLQLFFFFIWFSDGMIYVHGFYLLIASVHFGMYQALKSGKLKLITPWLIWKIIEVLYLVAVLFTGTIWRHHFTTWNVVFAFPLIVANLTMMFCLYKTQVESTEVRNFQVENESKKSTPDV